MKYRIDECVVCGINNPQIVINGWVENSADDIVIRANQKEVVRIPLKKSRSKVTTFYYSIPVNNASLFEVYFEGQETTLATKVSSHLYNRIGQKLQKSQVIKKIFGLEDKALQNEQRQLWKETYSLVKSEEYTEWLNKNECFTTKQFDYQPKISIVMPVYNVPSKYLGYCLDSILQQTYQNFEVCIADDCSTNQDTIDTLKMYMEKDARIKVFFRKQNGHISRATNSALELATGTYIGLMDNDDKLEKHALAEVVAALNNDPEIDFIYTDEDKIDMEEVRSEPHFKPDFSLDTLFGGNYICHFSVIKKTLIDQIGGFRVGYEGAQDFDLFLRLSNVVKNVYHIPKVLYHWRMIPGSTAVGGDGAKNYAGKAGKRALEDYFDKKGIAVNIDNMISTHYFVEYLFEDTPLVEILFLTDTDQGVSTALELLRRDTRYNHYHITVVSRTEIYLKDEKVIVNENLTVGVNQAVSTTNAKFIAIIDSKTIIESVDWLDIFIGYCKQAHIGAVSGKVFDVKGITRASGIFVGEKGLLPGYYPTIRKDGGLYGRLLVPYNFLAVNHYGCMIEKEKMSTLNEQYDIDFAFYDLCLRLYQKGFANICIPQVEFINNAVKDICKINTSACILNWQQMIGKDPYYNSNLSNQSVFRLDN